MVTDNNNNADYNDIITFCDMPFMIDEKCGKIDISRDIQLSMEIHNARLQHAIENGLLDTDICQCDKPHNVHNVH